MSDVAERVGVSRSYVWRLEKDQRRLNTKLLAKLAQAFDVEPAVLIGGEPRDVVHRRQETLVGHLLNARPLNPRFVEKVLDHILDELLPDDPHIKTIRDWDGRLLDMGSGAALLERLTPKAGEIASHLEELDKAMSYPEFRTRLRKAVQRWPSEHREQFVTDLLPEILRRPGRYRRLTGEDIFATSEPDVNRLQRFPLLLEGDDPRGTLLGQSGHLDLTTKLTGESLYAFSMPDDSMSPRYARGGILLADSDLRVADGLPAVIGVDRLPTTVRIIHREGDDVRLTPLSVQFPEAVHSAEDVRWMHPVVRVIGE